MDLAQYPPRPIGSPDDPLADPFDDPSYSFSYRAADHSRSEDNDATGRVRGKNFIYRINNLLKSFLSPCRSLFLY